MKKKIIALLGMTVMSCALVTGCGGSKTPAAESEAATEAPAEEQEGTDALTEEQTSDEADAQEETEEKTAAAVLEDGTYTAEFDTDSSMFHVNEACEGKGTLTVKDGIMTIHVSMPSKNIVNLYPGLAEDAQKEGAELLQPTTDTVTYSDGMTEEVNGFDVPVPALDEELSHGRPGQFARVVVLWRKKYENENYFDKNGRNSAGGSSSCNRCRITEYGGSGCGKQYRIRLI